MANNQAGGGPSPYTVVQTLSAEEAVTAALREAILSGRLQPGQRLAQTEIAEQLGVSRIPLRDALRRLEEDSLVKIDGRRGAWVTSLNPADVAEIYEMRIMLESRCVYYSVQNLDEESAAHLLMLSTQMDEVGHDVAAGMTARRTFYRELYGFSDRPRMRRLIMQLRDNVGRYHLIKNIDHAQEAHEELRRCIRDRDAEGAVSIVKEHLKEARDDLLATMANEVAKEAADA